MKRAAFVLACVFAAGVGQAEWPGKTPEGVLLPNGWRITPIGKAIPTEDLLLQMVPTPDGGGVLAIHSGYNPHGLVLVDAETDEVRQRVPLPASWFGLAWSPDGAKLYVSGGNAKKKGNEREPTQPAPVYIFAYEGGRLSDQPRATLIQPLPSEAVFWAGIAHHPSKPLLYAANRTANLIAVFDTAAGQLVGAIPTELNPFDLVLSPDGKILYCSNWGSDTVSFIDTEAQKVSATLSVGDNPNDLELARDGRLFVACGNDNTVHVIDTARGRCTETIVTSMSPRAPEGSTPNALALDPAQKTLYVANADNYNVCVVDVEEPGESTVLGFIPAGWYPSAIAVSADGKKLYIGNGKGLGSYSNVRGPHSPLRDEGEGHGSVKSLQKGSINIVDIEANRRKLVELTRQAYANCPYNDELLAQAKPPAAGPSVVPSTVGEGSPIKHVIYIIKENRTYDQVFGDLERGNGDARLCLFGREVTPNHHKLAEQFVLLDNTYCDAEVSWDGHQWSNAAYATDFSEKYWPAAYADYSDAPLSPAALPGAGYLWDQCFRSGLTYRSYGEFAERVSDDEKGNPNRPASSYGEGGAGDGGHMEPVHSSLGALHGHIAPTYLCWGARDFENAAEFIREFDEYERNYDSRDPNKRLPNFIVMSLPEDHTFGALPGKPTPRACVASNDYGLGLIVDRISHSPYWKETAIFTIEDDAQDGPDHVDARRTVALCISPYTKRGSVDSTLYTTCSILRTIELLLGLQPMSQYDAAATPMYTTLSGAFDPTPYDHEEPRIGLDEKNTATAWGAERSGEMDFSTYDRAPMFALNEIIWKNVKGAASEMPAIIHRFQVSIRR